MNDFHFQGLAGRQSKPRLSYCVLKGVVVWPFPALSVEHGSTHCQLPSALGFQTKIMRQQEISHLTSCYTSIHTCSVLAASLPPNVFGNSRSSTKCKAIHNEKSLLGQPAGEIASHGALRMATNQISPKASCLDSELPTKSK